MKKTKKIPYTPKYKIGGIFSKEERSIFNPDADDKKKMKKFGKQAGTAAYGVGEGLLDTVTMGATDQLTDQGYYALQKAGNSTEDEMREQNSIRGFSNAAGAVGGAIINPGATGAAIGQVGKGLGAGISEGNKSKGWAQDAGMALNTAGKVGSMAYGMSGSPMTPGMEAQASSFNSSDFGQGLGKYNEFMGQGNMKGLTGMMGGAEGDPSGIMGMLGGMDFAMGGMNNIPNAIPQYPNGGTMPRLKPRNFAAEKANYEEATRGANQGDGSGISSAELAYKYSKLIDPTGATSAVEIGKNFYTGNAQDPIDYLGLIRIPFVKQGMKPLSKLAKQRNKASVLNTIITKSNDVAESFSYGGVSQSDVIHAPEMGGYFRKKRK